MFDALDVIRLEREKAQNLVLWCGLYKEDQRQVMLSEIEAFAKRLIKRFYDKAHQSLAGG